MPEQNQEARKIFEDGHWLWEKHYPEGIDWRAPCTPYPLPELLDRARAAFAQNTLCDFQGKSFTYEEIGALADKAAAGLQKIGVGKGTHVGLFLPNTPYSIIFYFGILKAGGTVVNYNPLYVEHELKRQIEDSETTVMVTADVRFLTDKMEEMFGATRLKKVIVCPMAEILPFPKSLLYPFLKSAAKPAYGERYLRYADIVDNDGAFTPRPVNLEGDIAVLQYTGGTTGVPKGAMLTHANLSSNVEQVVTWCGRLIVPGKEVMMGILPFFHVFAMTVVLNCALKTGMKIVLHPKFVLKDILKSIVRHKVTIFPAVPAIFNAIAVSPFSKKVDFSSLKFCMSGGAPLSGEVQRLFSEKTRCAALAEGYGLTESSPVVAFNPPFGVVKAGSIGLPVPETTVRIVDPESGADLGVGEKGELCVAGPQVMKGYYKRPDETAAVLKDGLLHTGDVAVFGEDGYLHIVDRIKDMVIIRGYKVYPRFVEEALYRHPAVEECIVAGVPDAERGETVWAWIKLTAGMTATDESLREFLADKISPIEMPRRFILRTEPLPRTAVGKPDRKAVLVEEGIVKPA